MFLKNFSKLNFGMFFVFISRPCPRGQRRHMSGKSFRELPKIQFQKIFRTDVWKDFECMYSTDFL